jgi:hypothetical protein
VRVSLRGLDNCSGHLPAVTWANIEQPSALANTSYRTLFPFDQVIVDRDNNSIPGENNEDENLIPASAADGLASPVMPLPA